MMRSMFSGVSGLRNHQTKMDVIAHNISNVNTVGFKSSRVTFSDVFSQTVSGASKANENTGKGGTNPMQIGLGVGVSSIDKNMGTGAAQRTDRALDMMINGDGFFIVSDNSGTYFTRAGAFELDSMGYLVMGNGMRVNGWDTSVNDEGRTVVDSGTVVAPIQISGDKQSADPSPTTHIELSGNLNSTTIGESDNGHTSTVSFFDSTGNRWVVDVTFEYEKTTGAWTSTIKNTAYLEGDRKSTGINVAPSPATFTVAFDTNGKLLAANKEQTITFTATDIKPAATLGDGGEIKFDLSGLTQFGKETTSAKFNSVNGNYSGTLEGLSVGSDGIITGRYSNGDTKTLGQVPIATFQNPAGLEAVGNNLYVTTANSGDFDGTGQETGNIMGGVLEMSNVDLSSEFTEMITTQRGFQASSRLITTSDEMLQELVNLKR